MTELRAMLDRSEPMKLIVRSFCHIWSRDGQHIGWRSYSDLNDSLLSAFGYKLASSTGYDLLAREKKSFESNDITAFKTRPAFSWPKSTTLEAV